MLAAAEFSSDALARYPNLLSPIKLGPLTLRHRAVVAGHSMVMGESDGTVGERLCAYVAARAQGGAAFIGMESAPVHAGSVHYAQQLRLYDDAVLPGLTRAADAVHAAGSLLSIILWHGGHNVTHYGGQPGVAPLSGPFLYDRRNTQSPQRRGDSRDRCRLWLGRAPLPRGGP